MRQPFTNFKRDKSRYYVQRWNSELGKYSTAISTGQTSKATAMAWVKDATERGFFEST